MKNQINNIAIIIGAISFILLIAGAFVPGLTSFAGLGILSAVSLKGVCFLLSGLNLLKS